MAEARETIQIPHDAANEATLLAAACVSEDARRQLLASLPPDHFIAPQHSSAWTALAELERRHLSFDVATLVQCGIRVGVTVDQRYLLDLIEQRPNPPKDLDFHVEALRWDHARILGVTGPVSELLAALRVPATDPARVRALSVAVARAFDGHHTNHLLDPDKLVTDQVADITRRASGRATWPFGIPALDFFEDGRPRLVPGAAPGLVTVVTGLSGSSKSPLAANLALGLARQRRRGLYGAWEVPPGTVLEWLACVSIAQQDPDFATRADVARGHVEPDQVERLRERMSEIAKWVSFMSNPFRRHVGHQEDKRNQNDAHLDLLQQHISDAGAEWFVGDLFDRLVTDDRPGPFSGALFRVQAMAEELRCHMVLVAQQRLKDVEQRADKRPTREGIMGTSAWVQVADNIFAVHRQSLFHNVPDDTADVMILKQRYERWPQLIRFDWDPLRYTYTNGVEVPFEHAQETSENELDRKLGVNVNRGGKRR